MISRLNPLNNFTSPSETRKPQPNPTPPTKSPLFQEFLNSESILNDSLTPLINSNKCLDISSINMLEYLDQKVEETFNEAINNIIKIKETLKNKINIIFSFGCPSENANIIKKELQALRTKIIKNNYPLPLLQHFSILLDKYRKLQDIPNKGFVLNIDTVKHKIHEYLDTVKEESTELLKRGLENVERWTYEAVKEDMMTVSISTKENIKPFYQLTELNLVNFKNKIQTGINFQFKGQRAWSFIQKHEDGSKRMFVLGGDGKKQVSYKVGCLDNTGNWVKDDVKFMYWEEGNMFLLGEKVSREMLSLSFFKVIKGCMKRIISYKVAMRKTRMHNTFDLVGDRGLLIIAKGTALNIYKIGTTSKKDIRFQEPIVLVKYLKEIKYIAVLTVGYLYIKEINDDNGFGRIVYKIPINIEEREVYELIAKGNVLLLKRQEGFIGVELTENGYRLFDKKWAAKEKVTHVVIFPKQKMLLFGLNEMNPRVYDYWQERYIECRLWKEKLTHTKIEFVSEDAERMIVKTPKAIYECKLVKEEEK